jgi:hypothetical protein
VSVDMSAPAVEARLRAASAMAGSLRPDDRLVTKIDLSREGVVARLRTASDLLDACRALKRASTSFCRLNSSHTKHLPGMKEKS